MPSAYYPIMVGVCVAYVMAWIKSGGLEIHTSLLVILVLLLAPSLIARTEAAETIAERQSGETPSWNRRATSFADATG